MASKARKPHTSKEVSSKGTTYTTLVPDEYGDRGKQVGAQYATMDTVLPEKALHTDRTLRKGGADGLVFWMTEPRPPGMSREGWEAFTQERWDRAFS